MDRHPTGRIADLPARRSKVNDAVRSTPAFRALMRGTELAKLANGTALRLTPPSPDAVPLFSARARARARMGAT